MQASVASNYTSPHLLDFISYKGEPMTTPFRRYSIQEGWSLVWPFLLTILIGILLRAVSPHLSLPWWIAKDALIALSDALMVGGIVGAGLELWATRFLIDKVADDLQEKLVGKGLPSQLQSQISDLVKTALVREDYKKVYRVISQPGTATIQLDVTASYKVRNYSDVDNKVVPIFQDEIFYNPQVLSMEYGLVGKERCTETTESTDATTQVKTVKGREVTIEPKRRNENSVCDVTMRYKLTMPEEYSDVTSFAYPTLGADIQVQAIPAGFEFSSTGETTSSIHANGDKVWHFDRPFITNQHIRIWWFKKSTSSISQT